MTTQNLTPQDKLNLLYFVSTKRINPSPKGDGHLDGGRICACCGTVSAADIKIYRDTGRKNKRKDIDTMTKSQVLAYYNMGNKMITHRIPVDGDAPEAELSNVLLIPDDTGCFMIEWEDV